MTVRADTTGFREVRAGKEPDDLEDLMNLIADPEDEGGEEDEDGEDDDVQAFIDDNTVRTGEEDEDEAAGTPPPGGGAHTQVPPVVDTSLQDLARTLLAREQREQAARDAEAQRRAEQDNAPRPVYDPAALELSEEEAATYAASRGVIEKLVRAELNRYHETTQPGVRQTLDSLRQELNQLRPSVDRSTDVALTAALRNAVPDLDARVQSAGWKDYLARPVPYQGGRTFGQLLHEAVNIHRDADTAIAIIRDYAVEGAATPPARSAAPGRSGGGAPASVAAAVKRGGDKGKKIPYSAFIRATEQVQSGKLSVDKYQKISDHYMDMHDRGLVDMNA